MGRKLRILWCGEATFLNTGYAVYGKELLSRLYDTGKYIIAEMACYAESKNPAIFDVPWRVYPTLPVNDTENQEYASSVTHQFGEWRFNDVCLDFKPDVVIDIRDWWMIEYQSRSVFRDMFEWAIMPTVDSAPQQEQYIHTYTNADAVFTYSEFGKEVLEKDGNGHINITGIASPGANFDYLKPVPNKGQLRESFGFLPDVNIVGTVMRNQRRKLYPNLIKSFRQMLDENPSLNKKTFLYLHTAHPDLGWDLPYFIRKYNMGNHTLLTYKCKNCNYFFPSFFQGVTIPCVNCNHNSAVLPTTAFGVTTEELGIIMNWFDLYVQYSICEGFGMPQVEAAACGVPVLTVKYSAMESVGKNLKADFVDVLAYFWDSPTHSERAIPDDKQLINKMKKFLSLPKSMRSKKGMDAYICAKKKYSWDNAAKSWMKYLDKVKIKNTSETWEKPPEIKQPNQEVPQGLSNESFIRWSVENIWHRPEKLGTFESLRMLRDLNEGKTLSKGENIHYSESSYQENTNYSEFNRENVVNVLKTMRDYENFWEKRRENFISGDYPKPEFIAGCKPDNNPENNK